MKVRMMLPMTIRCGTCGNYIYKGTKFNSRKEDVVYEKYLGIHISRFYLKCTNCRAEITFKTDPKNSDYIVESGNFKHFSSSQDEKAKQKRNAELEICDPIKSLENKTAISKRQMDMLASLNELKSMKSRQLTVSIDAMLEGLQRSDEAKVQKMESEDEALIRSVFQGSNSTEIVKRILEELEIDEEEDDGVANFFTSESSESEKNYSVKRRKVIDHNPNNSDYTKFIFKSSSVRISIVKKPLSDSNSKKIEERNKISNGRNHYVNNTKMIKIN